MSNLYILNGPEIGDVFEIKDGISFLGRAEDNDIRVADKTVSRKHLRIVRKGGQYFIADLESRNGTYCDGKYLIPNIEVEVRQGIPIAIGMSVIGIGKVCLDYLVPFLDLIALTKGVSEQSEIWEDHREKTNQRILELLYKVSDLLMKSLPIRETAQEILHYVFDLLKRIERGAFILVDPETREIMEIVLKSRNPTDVISTSFCRDVVNRVIEEKKPVLVLDADAEEDEGLADTLEVLGIKSVMCVPLMSGSQMLGVIYVDSLQRPCGFRKDDLCLLMDLSQRTAVAIEHSLLSETLSQLADELPLL
ncbi:MAG: FHA domain-containing protein [Desulfobacterales bacterium]|nr:FHA domain-containing protein [Desulfobacterales bacterium]